MSNITFLMRSLKDKNVQDRLVDHNSERLSCLTSKHFFKFVTILAAYRKSETQDTHVTVLEKWTRDSRRTLVGP